MSVVPGFAWRRRATRSSTLCAGSCPPFARLRALGELYLQILRRADVFDRHAEASGRDLLYRAVPGGAEALGVLAAFAGVGHRAESVQGEGDRFVRLRRERAERHRAADEMLDDGIDGLDFMVFLT